MRTLLTSSSVVLALTVLGCSESTTVQPDSGIMFVAPDVGPDTGTTGSVDAAADADGEDVLGDVGLVCMSDIDCEAVCADESSGFRDGYCTNFCDDANPCPTGSACVQVGRDQSICFNECDPSAEVRECRAGYGCATSVMLPAPVCVPGCTDDTDCAAGQRCNPATGGNCYDPEAAWGDACEGTSQCPDEAFCFAEGFRGWPGGMCLAFGCDTAADDGGGCPASTVCIPSGRPGYGICAPGCDDDDGCRPGYSCDSHADYPERLACLPACTEDSECTDGRRCGAEGTCE